MLFVNIDMPLYMVQEIRKKEKAEIDFDFSRWVVKRFHQEFMDEELITNYSKKNLAEAQALLDM